MNERDLQLAFNQEMLYALRHLQNQIHQVTYQLSSDVPRSSISIPSPVDSYLANMFMLNDEIRAFPRNNREAAKLLKKEE